MSIPHLIHTFAELHAELKAHYAQSSLSIISRITGGFLAEPAFITGAQLHPVYHPFHLLLTWLWHHQNLSERAKMNSYPPFGLGKVLLKLGTHTILKVLLRGAVSCNPGTGSAQVSKDICEDVPAFCFAPLVMLAQLPFMPKCILRGDSQHLVHLHESTDEFLG